jgi:NADH-quinone oxidoreductase subunit C
MSDAITSARPDLVALASAFTDLNLAPRPLHTGPTCDQLYVRPPADRLLAVMRFLRDDPACRYEQLCDLTCIDYLEFPEADDRYGVIYSLLSLTLGHRLWLKVFVNDPEPAVDSVTAVWAGAEWLEREVFDLFGVHFNGHPDLRRIVTWDAFEAHPLRKDYPLRGQGERENYERVTRDSA